MTQAGMRPSGTEGAGGGHGRDRAGWTGGPVKPCMTWLSSAIGVGLAIGAPAAGRLIDVSGARAGYLLAAASGAAAFVTCLARLWRLRTPPPDTGAGPAPAALQVCGQD